MNHEARIVYTSIAIDFSVKQLLGLLASAPPESIAQAYETVRAAWPDMPPAWQTLVTAGAAPLLGEAVKQATARERNRIAVLAQELDNASRGMSDEQLREFSKAMTEEQRTVLVYVVQARAAQQAQQATQQTPQAPAPLVTVPPVQNGQNGHHEPSQEAPRVEIVPSS